MIGSYLITFSFSCALVSMIAFFWTIRKADDLMTSVARACFHSSAVIYMIACALQMYLIATHQYQYTYIWEHASRNLSTPLLMASFYAGQEGSFMLWTLFTFLIGVFVLGYAQRVRYESQVMAFYTAVLVCLTLILVVKSPFNTIFQSFPDQNIPANFVPRNGKGLNPTLENLWITIHPPILFTGFAAMSVPFVFALAGLIKKDYQKWITIALPWTLFASMVLGFGIMLGGWWAYETLGWGGFWAWDPVENSSLIPWLACVALVHTMLVQKRTGSYDQKTGTQTIGGLVKTNFALAIMSFGLILYSTFLTRSGVLGDTSVHSFVDAGAFVYAVLLCINIVFVLGGFTVLIWRWKDLNRASLDMKLMSREMSLGLGSSVILASALFVLIGTSWPLLRSMVGEKKVALQADFYNGPHLWIAMAVVLLNAIGMVLKWKNTTPSEFMRKIRWSILIAFLGTLGLILLGVDSPVFLFLGFGSLLAIVVNVQIGAKVIRGNRRFIGAYVSHTGISLLMIGVIFTSRYSQTQHVQLVEGETKKVFDYKVTYKGAKQVMLERDDQERYEHVIELEKNGDKDIIKPIVFLSDFNRRESAFTEPGIKYTPTRDIYLSPKAIDEVGGDPRATLRKGEKTKMPFDSSVTVRFEKFDMSRAQEAQEQGAVIEVATKDSTFFLTAYRHLPEGNYQSVPIAGTDMSVGFYDLKADKDNLSNSQAVLQFRSKSHPPGPTKPVITMDISIKPFISLVWAGVIIMVGGFFFAMLRRRKEMLQIVNAPVPVVLAPGTKPNLGSGGYATPSTRRSED